MRNVLNASQIKSRLGEAVSHPRTKQSCSEKVEATTEDIHETIREMVIDEHRVDILAEFVLGYTPQLFHQEMMDWQDTYQEGLLLAWRGAAKTTFCTIARSIFEIIHNPNIRILLVSDAVDQAKGMLRQIKSHFERNQLLRDIFGDYSTKAPVWSDNAITVNRRTAHYGEPTIFVAGTGTALPSRHYDIIIGDDLVTEDNSQTETQRQKLHDYFYRTLFPTLESPNGRMYIIGTRWDENDLYGWLEKEDYVDSTLRIGVLDEETDRSRWEEKYPTERMHRIRKANLAAFELQYMCRSGIGLGGIFSPEHFLYYDGAQPADSFKWQAADLAIGQRDVNDFFAHATVCIQKSSRDPYLIDYRKTRMPFPRQVEFIAKRYREHPDTMRVVIERNAYQEALRQQVQKDFPDVPTLGHWTHKDKVTRAQKLAYFLTDHPLRVKRQHSGLVRLLCGFPNLRGSKDVFDAIDLAISRGLRGARKRRDNEPGLL